MVTIRKILNMIAIIGVTFVIVRASLYIETVMIKDIETLQPSFVLVDITEHTKLVEKWYGYTEETIGWTLLLQNIGGPAKNVNITVPIEEPVYVWKSTEVWNEWAYFEMINPRQIFGVYIYDLYPEILVKYDKGQQTITIYEIES